MWPMELASRPSPAPPGQPTGTARPAPLTGTGRTATTAKLKPTGAGFPPDVHTPAAAAPPTAARADPQPRGFASGTRHAARQEGALLWSAVGRGVERVQTECLAMKKVFTTGQVAKICKVAPRTVSKWFDSGRLKGYRIPGSQDRRIPREQLIRFLKEHGMPLGELGS